MRKIAILKKGEITINEILEKMKTDPKIRKCGAIVSFVGQVREEGRDGGKVIKLIYEHAGEIALNELREIREEIINKYEVEEVIIYHFVGELEPLDNTIYIIVAAKHRKPAFEAAMEALELVKKKLHIWKKEITDKGEYWIIGDEVVKETR